ncbi:MAG TPA: hypothetical protein VHV75_09905 [Solirubrobacteraceae bacterium]|jgi:hypothetical protein|nr:hypothetical protein [Solirubrobacteraceae bacterium]
MSPELRGVIAGAIIVTAIVIGWVINEIGQWWVNRHAFVSRKSVFDWQLHVDTHIDLLSDEELEAGFQRLLADVYPAPRGRRVLPAVETQEREARAALGYPVVVPFRTRGDLA